jgi:hypothetical protein
MLLKISLIVAILAGLAVGTLNFVKTKEKVVTLAADRDNEKGMKETAQKDLASTRKTLASTKAELDTTKQNLEATTAEKDKAVSDLAAQTKRAERLTDDLNKTRRELNDTSAELAAYTATGLKPEQIVAINKSYKGLQDQIKGLQGENQLLGRTIVRLTNELAIYKTPDYQVPLPPGLKGKVLVADPKWNFVVLNVGEDQGVLEQGELLVNRNGKLVAKVKIRSVQKDRSIANVMPGWQLGDVMEGDQVIPAHPQAT